MKLIGITPNNIGFERLKDSVRLLKEKGVSLLYVRNPFVFSENELKILANHLLSNGITPIISHSLSPLLKSIPLIFHFKECEKDKIPRFREQNPMLEISVSCHSPEEGKRLLDNLADFIFLSPVFKPYSKKEYNAEPLDLKKVEPLIKLYGERVFLLGGMDMKRIDFLKKRFGDNIAVAGITMFFGDTDEDLS